MPGRGDQAGYGTWSREVAGTQRRVCKDLAEYYGQEGAPARRQRLGRGTGQIQKILFAGAWGGGLKPSLPAGEPRGLQGSSPSSVNRVFHLSDLRRVNGGFASP